MGRIMKDSVILIDRNSEEGRKFLAENPDVAKKLERQKRETTRSTDDTEKSELTSDTLFKCLQDANAEARNKRELAEQLIKDASKDDPAFAQSIERFVRLRETLVNHPTGLDELRKCSEDRVALKDIEDKVNKINGPHGNRPLNTNTDNGLVDLAEF